MSWSIRIGYLIPIALLSACADAPTPDEQLAERAKASVRDTLKDPASAKFKEVRASAQANCIYGKVLAKNSYGAYTGYQEFVWSNGETFINPGTSDLASEDKLGGRDKFDAFISYEKAHLNCLSKLTARGSNASASDIPDDPMS